MAWSVRQFCSEATRKWQAADLLLGGIKQRSHQVRGRSCQVMQGNCRSTTTHQFVRLCHSDIRTIDTKLEHELADDSDNLKLADDSDSLKLANDTDCQKLADVTDSLLADDMNHLTLADDTSYPTLPSEKCPSLTDAEIKSNLEQIPDDYSDLDEQASTLDHADNADLSHVTDKYLDLYKDIGEHHSKPAAVTKSYNLAAYVNESEVLSNLVRLGVDLSKVETKRSEANNLIKLDFERDVKPYLMFLHDVGVPSDMLGSLITKHPGIFREDLDDLRVRVNYLQSKKFSVDAIARIISVAPQAMSLTTKELDAQLGYFQKEFKLKGKEVRFVFTRYPKLTVISRQNIKNMKFELKEYLGFMDNEIKHILLDCPKIYAQDADLMSDRFDYIHNEMKIEHKEILKWPQILNTRKHIVHQRHTFLKHLTRDQYDPQKPNFVSLRALVTAKDQEYCDNIAKVPLEDYNRFMKTL